MIQKLIDAEGKAKILFSEIEKRELITPNKKESTLNIEIYKLAKELFGIKKYWHKRIVRSGENTLETYHGNPDDRIIESDDIIFLDFGPIFEELEADFGRTYVLGNNPIKKKIIEDIENIWYLGRDFYYKNPEMTGEELFLFISEQTEKKGYIYHTEYAGHLIGTFPHEHIQGEETNNYIKPGNNIPMTSRDKNGSERFWILELHIRHYELPIGAFFEQLLI